MQFKCSECNTEIEEFLTLKQAESFKECPKCKKSTLKKLIGGGNFILTGSGFYKTDYPKNECKS